MLEVTDQEPGRFVDGVKWEDEKEGDEDEEGHCEEAGTAGSAVEFEWETEEEGETWHLMGFVDRSTLLYSTLLAAVVE